MHISVETKRRPGRKPVLVLCRGEERFLNNAIRQAGKLAGRMEFFLKRGFACDQTKGAAASDRARDRS